MLIGYARVSTNAQDTALQLEALRKAGCELIYEEKASGSKADRPQLAKMMDKARPGDTIVVWKIDRLARSLSQLVILVDKLRKEGIGFKCLTQDIDTTTANGRLVFGIFASLAEFERELIAERTKAGKIASGKFGGRPALTEAQVAQIRGHHAGGKSWRWIANEMKISQATIAKYVKTGAAAG